MTVKKKKSDYDYEIKFYEGLLEKKPDFAAVLGALGDVYTKAGFVKKGLEADLKLAKLRPEDPIVLYNLACSYSLLNDTNMALHHIKKAINRGYNNYQFIEQDEDLVNLRGDSRFKRYFQRVKSKRAQDVKE